MSFALQQALMRAGLSESEANNRFYVVDKDGLITHKRSGLTYGQRNFARDDMQEGLDLLKVHSMCIDRCV